MRRDEQAVQELLVSLALQIEASAAACDEIVKTAIYLVGDPITEAPRPPDLGDIPSDLERRTAAREWLISPQAYSSKYGSQMARCERILDVQRQLIALAQKVRSEL